MSLFVRVHSAFVSVCVNVCLTTPIRNVLCACHIANRIPNYTLNRCIYMYVHMFPQNPKRAQASLPANVTHAIRKTRSRRTNVISLCTHKTPRLTKPVLFGTGRRAHTPNTRLSVNLVSKYQSPVASSSTTTCPQYSSARDRERERERRQWHEAHSTHA